MLIPGQLVLEIEDDLRIGNELFHLDSRTEEECVGQHDGDESRPGIEIWSSCNIRQSRVTRDGHGNAESKGPAPDVLQLKSKAQVQREQDERTTGRCDFYGF